MTSDTNRINAAEALLRRLKQNGVDYLFANAGTDFAPIIEGYATGLKRGDALPEPVICPHETAAVGMCHGYYLMTGRPQAMMVHVNVGLANCVMGLINAAADNIPFLIMAGRTPITEHGRFGARMSVIQYGQEMRDQSALIRESVKWDYELRYGEQVELLVDRALAIARTAPAGPVYLGLPREPLAESWPADRAPPPMRQAAPTPPRPDPTAVEQAASWLAKAKAPLILCQRGDPAGRLGPALAALAERFAFAVVEYRPIRNVVPSDLAMLIGYDPVPHLGKADAVLVVDSQVPWVAGAGRPSSDAKVIHIGPDPLFQRMPVRSFENDLSITGDPAATVTALHAALDALGAGDGTRRVAIAARHAAWRKANLETAAKGNGAPMSPAFVSKCLSEAMDEDAVIFNELGAPADFATYKHANRQFSLPFSGGLGWGLPSALGAKLADRDRLVVACIGDGSYMFANPVACHQIAEANNLSVLTVVMNNGVWNAVRREALRLYPDGHAKAMNTVPMTPLTPSPDYGAIARASRGWSEDVEHGDDLPGAIARAIDIVRKDKRHALLNVRVSY